MPDKKPRRKPARRSTRQSTRHSRAVKLCALPAALALGGQACAAPAVFNTLMLAFPVDTQQFAEGKPVPAGAYTIDVYLNEDWKGKHRVRFVAPEPDAHIAQPCFSTDLLDALGFDLERIASKPPDAKTCAPLEHWVPTAAARYEPNIQRLNLAAPQIALARRVRGYVDPKHWDAGISAATLSYDYNAWHSRAPLSRATSQYLGLRAGVNVGDWRLRYHATVTHTHEAGVYAHTNALTLERALPGVKSAVRLGQTQTHASVFGSLPLTGVQLASDARMHPDARAGFAPIIQGIAQSTARVTVHQAGVQVYTTTVPPGAFRIDDLSPTGGGDLHVTVHEADGSEHSFTVPYTSLPELLRPGVTHYSVDAGRYRNRNLRHEPWLVATNLAHGINNTVTAYGGVLAGQGYQAASAGVGLNLPVGAVTFDLTVARTQGVSQGYGLRLAYSKFLPLTQTDVSIAVLRTATRGYLDAAQAFTLREHLRRGQALESPAQRRNQWNVQVSQPLPGAWGAFSLAASVHDDWGQTGREVQFSAAWGRSLGRASVSLATTRSRDRATQGWDNQVLLSLSLALEGKTSSAPTLSTSLTQGSGHQALHSSVAGSTDGTRPLHYNVYATLDRSREQQGRGAGASVGTTTRSVHLSASAAVDAGARRQFSVHAAGGVVLLRDGLVFTPELGDTVGIVRAQHGAGMHLANAPGVTLDRQGYAVVPYLQPYRENTVGLDPQGVSTDVELLNTSHKVAPTAGAVVLLDYPTRYGLSVLATVKRSNGGLVPFAAGVFDADGKNLGYVAQGGQALVRLEHTHGELTVRWGGSTDQQCRFAYDVAALSKAKPPGKTDPFRRLEVLCR